VSRLHSWRWAVAALLAALIAAPGVRSQIGIRVTNVANYRDAGFPPDDRAQGPVTREELIIDRLRRMGIENPDPAPTHPKDHADSLTWEQNRRAASMARTRKVVVSIYDRRLWLIDANGDTLIDARAGVGMGVARKGSHRYDFSTPRGARRIVAMNENPLWNPPDWHYWGMYPRVRRFPEGGVALTEGGRVVRRGTEIGILRDGRLKVLPREHPLIFDGVMYIPPFGTVNRQIPEVLGKFKIDTGEGILIHGTNDPLAIGFPATHGCIRLADEPLRQLYRAVKIGTPVYVY
jgi:hypothetical protein